MNDPIHVKEFEEIGKKVVALFNIPRDLSSNFTPPRYVVNGGNRTLEALGRAMVRVMNEEIGTRFDI